jgi:hypothetical protein
MLLYDLESNFENEGKYGTSTVTSLSLSSPSRHCTSDAGNECEPIRILRD